ncbi:hypothetical protein [Couchioplanes caeruleus]|uniref:Uncharacterized protein n=1 Tax=Couchioplanes caeruleus subsp. caeruleus TaxID=56427 RepID=A0A1K0GGS2_9ACTN|nr:hypothetical protein [Couchioplanes caeruleus]OJF10068.1 hypothetical protein BG844_34045 [Couchioplanes caeruleus subsp. caeruleus]
MSAPAQAAAAPASAPAAPPAQPTGSGGAPPASAPGGEPKPPASGEPGPPAPPDAQGAPTIDTTSLEAQDKAASTPEASNGRQRGERLRKASDMLIGGDLVGGDKLIMMLGGREPAPLQRLGTQLSDPVRYAWVEPQDWDRVRAACHGKRLVILRANPHQGKVAAAIRLLQSPSDRHIYSLDRNVDLHALPAWLETDASGDNALPKGAGFLLCEPVGWDGVEGWMLQQLAAALERLDAQLILTLGADVPLADADAQEYVVPLGAAKPHSEILARHLAWRLDDVGLAERILADPDIAELAEDQFAGAVSLKVAADLAVMISLELNGTVVDVDRVRRRMAERATEDFDIWFGGLPDVPTRCLAVALAVLNGLAYETVAHAAEMLSDRLDGPPDPGPNNALVPPWRPPFGRTRRERLRLLRAKIRPAMARGAYGTGPVEALEYAADDYPRLVLRHVWREFPLHRELMGWLRDLASDPNEEVRIWSGTALGMLSLDAFDFVYTQVLRPMALDQDNARNREVVAYALRVPAADSRLRPLVDAAVAALYGNRASPFGQATAARVHGVSLGPLGAVEALTALDRLAAIDHAQIALGIADSLADLIVQDEQQNAPLVLDRLLSWLNDRRRTLAGQFVFLQLARSLITEFTLPGPDGAAETRMTWPTLLMLADQRIELRRSLIGMWRHVLASGSFTRLVEVALDAWAALAEADADVRTSLSNMLVATAAQSDRSRALVKRLVAGWRAVDNLQPKPMTAYAVETAMDARSGDQ